MAGTLSGTFEEGPIPKVFLPLLCGITIDFVARYWIYATIL
jgi:hypothetical protein